jgi:hypothetical protein
MAHHQVHHLRLVTEAVILVPACSHLLHPAGHLERHHLLGREQVRLEVPLGHREGRLSS